MFGLTAVGISVREWLALSFGAVARWRIMAGAQGRTKPLVSPGTKSQGGGWGPTNFPSDLKTTCQVPPPSGASLGTHRPLGTFQTIALPLSYTKDFYSGPCLVRGSASLLFGGSFVVFPAFYGLTIATLTWQGSACGPLEEKLRAGTQSCDSKKPL